MYLQLRPDREDGEFGYWPEMVEAIDIADACFTMFFLAELAVNLTAHWFREFIKGKYIYITY